MFSTYIEVETTGIECNNQFLDILSISPTASSKEEIVATLLYSYCAGCIISITLRFIFCVMVERERVYQFFSRRENDECDKGKR